MDASEQQIRRPKRKGMEKYHCSDKAGEYAIKVQYTVNAKGLIVHNTRHSPGRVNDVQVYRMKHPTFPAALPSRVGEPPLLSEYAMRLTVFLDGRCTGQCVPSTVTSPPPGPGTIILNSSLVLHAAISFETFLAVGSTDASIRSITLRYLHTLVWSTPKIACSVPCGGCLFCV